MSTSNGDDHKTPPMAMVIRNPANREIVMHLGNLVIESKQHTVGLETIYVMLRDWPHPAPPLWGHQLVDEFERHMDREREHVDGLKSAFAR